MGAKFVFFLRIALIILWLFASSIAGLALCLFRRRGLDINRVFGRLFGRGALRLWGVELLVEGLETLETAGPCVIVANHQSAMDMVTFSSILPYRTVVFGKKQIGWIPLFGWLFAAGGNLLIDRKRHIGAVGGLKVAIEVIRKRGVLVWIFPEGTRNRGDCRELQPFKKGAFHIAIAASVPVVPIVCEPLHALVSWKERRIRGGKLRMRVLPPIPTTGLAEADLDALSADVRERFQARLPSPRDGPSLAQLIVTRRCNLSCGYCTEFDKTSEPVPFGDLQRRLRKLRDLGTWALSLMGGEPTMHPDLLRIVGEMRALGFRRRMMTTNALLLTREMIEGLNREGLTDVSVSVDGVKPNETTVKVLETLKKRLELLAKYARFDVVLSGVIGSSSREEVHEVVEFAKSHEFSPRILLLHDKDGQLNLSPEELAVYAEIKQKLGSAAREAHDYRDRLIETGEAPFRCRAGARYLYVDEAGMVRWCAQTRTGFGKDLMDYTLDDLREQFYKEKSCSTKCSVGCVRTASAYDEWRSQSPRPAAQP
jgi:1-acyl-sn-glycerol-3-phosphate acyltransferase